MLAKKTADDVLTAALSNGGRFAEIFIENNVKNSISTINGKIESALGGVDYGLGIRLFVKDKVIYVYTNDLSYENLIKCAKEAAAAIKGGDKRTILEFNRLDCRKNNLHSPVIMPETIRKKQITEMLCRASSAAFSYNSLITQTTVGYLDSVQEVCIINSEGLWVNDTRVRTRAAVSAVASKDNEKQTGYFGPGALKGFEFFEDVNLENTAVEAARSAVTMLKAKNSPSGKMSVVMDNGFGGVIFHEACGHGLEAAAVSKKESVFADKLGEKIASEKVTAIDDGTIKNSWGSINVDDEGVKTQKNVLIKNGILKGYMVDRFNGEKMGMNATGSSRRQSYKYIPVSRMTNTYIAAGTDKKEDIIKNTEYGLYAKYMGGGSVNTSSGEFNFAVNEAYIIRNGEIAEPVRGATLIGKGAEILNKIDMVSDNLALSEGMCGASSGSIPVDVGQPLLRVSEITVGGRG